MTLNVDTGRDLYVIACTHTRRCKIGCSNSTWRRLEQLQAYSPTELVMYCEAGGRGGDEWLLHHAFAEHRLHGEWFAPAAMHAIAEAVRYGNSADLERLIETLRARYLKAVEQRRLKPGAASPVPPTRARRGMFEWRGKWRPL